MISSDVSDAEEELLNSSSDVIMESASDHLPSSSNRIQTSSTLAIQPFNSPKPSKIPSPPTIFLDSTLLTDVCEKIFKELNQLIQARNELIHKDDYEKQWNRLNERVNYILSALTSTCLDEQDLAQKKFQDWIKGVDNSLQEVKILRTWVQNPSSLRGREAADFIPNFVHPRSLDLFFLSSDNFQSASPNLEMIQRNAALEEKVKKLQKVLLEQKVLLLEYKDVIEAKLAEARTREEILIRSNEEFKQEMKLQQESLQKQQAKTNKLLKQILEMFSKQANP
ncbi:hypothetical protein MtrunA17_Chr6g0472071 [Medicago truncatula]|uniref:Uncharacterized protein n=1 Tax=Medicago truncatula TaxID=3880 RepID=A0A396HEP0_MEDTR|nr:hypothetical protein MtrunA17_Chr6g0472071 [Medicago truncatula]